MSHKKYGDTVRSMEIPYARDLIHTRRLRAKASYVLAAYAGVKIRKKEGLPGLHKDSQVSNAS